MSIFILLLFFSVQFPTDDVYSISVAFIPSGAPSAGHYSILILINAIIKDFSNKNFVGKTMSCPPVHFSSACYADISLISSNQSNQINGPSCEILFEILWDSMRTCETLVRLGLALDFLSRLFWVSFQDSDVNWIVVSSFQRLALQVNFLSLSLSFFL